MMHWRNIKSFPRRTDGVAAVEAALFLSIMMVTTLALVEFGRWIFIQYELTQAVRAGVQEITREFNYKDNATTQATITGAMGLATPGLASPPTTFNPQVSSVQCYCLDQTDRTIQVACGAGDSCTAGYDGPLFYVTVSASYQFSPLFNVIPYFNTRTISESASALVQK
ncbi:MAG: TadE/TadG family type IV pilus assembly protein [Magnetospiraceae bacterium]